MTKTSNNLCEIPEKLLRGKTNKLFVSQQFLPACCLKIWNFIEVMKNSLVIFVNNFFILKSYILISFTEQHSKQLNFMSQITFQLSTVKLPLLIENYRKEYKRTQLNYDLNWNFVNFVNYWRKISDENPIYKF